MSEPIEKRYVTIIHRGRPIKVRFPPPISDEGMRVYKSILDNAEAMRLRDKGRE